MTESTDGMRDPYHGENPKHHVQARMPVAMSVALAVATLYLARDVLVPLALAAMLSFALSPPILLLRRRRVPRVASVIIVVTIAFVGIFSVGRVVVSQVTSLADNLPVYQQNLVDKVRSVQGGVTDVQGGVFGKASEMLRNLGQQLDGKENNANVLNAHKTVRPGVATNVIAPPMQVEIRQPAPAPLQLVQSILGPLLSPLATTGLIVVFVLSFLMQRENLRDRFIRLVGARDLHRTTAALNDAGERVSRYLLLQLLVNSVYAIPIGAGLVVIGVPNALLWAMLVIILRFIPYLGIVIAAIFPLALSLAIDPGWNMLAWTAALFITIEMISGNIIEPWLYGSKTGLSSIAIIFAATFWTWLWGPIGLLLSTPLTVCVVVLGRHVPQLRFLDVLLGSDAPLAPEETFYQRLLADDPAEAAQHCEQYLRSHELPQLYDELIVPALILAQEDSDRGVLTRELRTRVTRGIGEVIDFFKPVEAATIDNDNKSAGFTAALNDSSPTVLCIAARNDLDEVAAGLLSQLLQQHGVAVKVIDADTIASAVDSGNQPIDLASTATVKVIFLSYISSISPTKARLLIRKLRRRYLLDTKVFVGFWLAPKLDEEGEQHRLVTTGADLVLTSIQDAVAHIVETIVPDNREMFDLTEAAARALSNTYQTRKGPGAGDSPIQN